MAEFLAMGGYGAYVWPALAVAAAALAALLLASLRGLRAAEDELRRLEAAGPERDGQ